MSVEIALRVEVRQKRYLELAGNGAPEPEPTPPKGTHEAGGG